MGRVHCFHNPVSGKDRMVDPRLESLPSEWKPCEAEEISNEAERVAWFRNEGTGEILNSDPRLLPAALEGRGVDVRKIELV